MEFRILGPLQVLDADREVPLGSPKERALLAVLLLHAGEIVSRDRLIDELWGESPPLTAAKALNVHVSQLRKTLTRYGRDPIETRAPGYALRIDGSGLDREQFDRLVEEARGRAAAGDAKAAASLFRDALALWRGPALAGIELEAAARNEIGRLEELRLAAQMDLIDCELGLGRHEQVIGELEVLVGEHPLRERLRSQLMLALYRSGRQAEALAAYREARTALSELGIEPSEHLRELERAILTQDATLAPTRRSTNLPVVPGPLIGREEELARIRKLIGDGVRLLTLTGPGGSGKTRLALASAAELVDDFADGVWFVSLASHRDTELVEQTIAEVIGARGNLKEFLRGRQLLLVLDNLEQLLPDIAETVAGLETKVLATSRERLNLRAEHEYQVPMLPLDDAVELFVQRARQLELRFQPDEHVSEIARRLDGLPLALELAAARVKTLTPQQIVERLTQSLDLLTGGPRDAPGHQQMLRETLEWSYQLLDQEEQTLFARLAVFVGGCTLNAAEQVADAKLDLLQSLVDKNLLRHSNERFWMLETIRELALEKLELLGDAEQLRRRHAECVLEFVTGLRNEPLDVGRFVRARAESSNVRAAVEWALNGKHADLALTLASARLLNVSPLRRASWLDAALLLGDRADPTVYANGLSVRAGHYGFLGEFDRAEALAQRSLTLFRALGDRAGEAGILMLMGFVATERGDYDRARELLEHALRLAEASGATELRYGALRNLGQLERRTGNLDRSAALLEQALQLALDAGDTYNAGGMEHGLGDVALAVGDAASAERCYLRALSRARELDAPHLLAYCLAGLACVAAMRGERERAGRLWGASQAVQQSAEVELLAYIRRCYEEALATITGPEFDHAVNETRHKQPDAALATALEEGV